MNCEGSCKNYIRKGMKKKIQIICQMWLLIFYGETITQESWWKLDMKKIRAYLGSLYVDSCQ